MVGVGAVRVLVDPGLVPVGMRVGEPGRRVVVVVVVPVVVGVVVAQFRVRVLVLVLVIRARRADETMGTSRGPGAGAFEARVSSIPRCSG